MSGPDRQALARRILSDAPDALSEFEALPAADRNALIDQLLDNPRGRRWLRRQPGLTLEVVARLLIFEDDFRSQRHDDSLANVIALAPREAIERHLTAIASGAGAPALWERLAPFPDALVDAALRIIAGGEHEAVTATLTHLLLDPLDPYRLGREQRTAIATGALDADDPDARGVAAEFLASSSPDALVERLPTLMHDGSRRVRGYSWLAAYRVDRERTTGRAIALLGDESVPSDVRQSALNATGEALPTEAVVDLLTYFVVHPSAELATEAANLLFRHHRHPQIAIAAAESPHSEVREIAATLLDPYRGSPAAGGSRRGDPLRADPLIEMLRELEDEDETRGRDEGKTGSGE